MTLAAKILVVEDENIVAMDIQVCLQGLGYDVPATLASGEDAVAHVQCDKPDLVLMDIRLAGEMDGVEAAESIRKRFDVPVIYLTAQVDNHTLQRAKTTGPFGYVLKPFEERDLYTTIEMALSKHQMERQLRDGEERMRRIVENALDAVVTMDAAGDIVEWNRQAEKIFGWNRDEVIGKNLATTIIPLPYREEHRRGLQAYLATGAGPLLNRRIDDLFALRRDGREFPIELSISPVKCSDRPCFSAFVRDITDRKTARQRLEKSEQKYRTLVETTQTGYLIIDGEGTVVDANAEYVRLSGHLTLQDILGHSVAEWTAEHDRERTAAEIRKCLEQGFIRNFEIDYVSPSGMTTPIEINATVIETDEGRRILSLCRDITERREAEEALKQSNADLDEYAYVVSHDLKEPLGMIFRHVQMLQRRHAQTLSPEAAQRAEKIVQGAKQMETLIKVLYENSKVGRGSVEQVDCDFVLTEVLDELQPAIAQLDATVTYDPLPTVTANRTDVFRVFQNLIGNALKFCAETRRLQIHIGYSREGGKHWFLVRDNGIGIADENQERVFQFGERVGDKDVPGTGIGLATCKKAIERRGGKMWVESSPGEGSTFYFTLPATWP